MMKKLLIPIAVSLLLVACGSEDGDDGGDSAAAKDAAEELLEEELDATASCEDPGSTEVGTLITCTLEYGDGTTESGTFAEIVEGEQVEITVISEE